MHISEMSYHKRIMKTDDVVSTGQSVSVMIKSVDAENRRIALSIKDAEGDPWVNIRERYQVGQKVAGSIEKKESFGYFVALEPGVVGLLPISKIHAASDPKQFEKLNVNDQVVVSIDSVNPEERKIGLGLADANDKTEWRQYAKRNEKKAPMGDLGEKLKAALQSKK